MYTVMSRDQKLWDIVNKTKLYSGIRNSMKSANACYHSMQNFSTSSLLIKNMQTGIYRIIILSVVLYGSETWFPTLRDADGVSE